MIHWVKDEDGNFYTQKIFHGVVYKLGVHPWVYNKTILFYISLSSGKKRKELNIYEEKRTKTGNGMAPLVWVKDILLNFESEDFLQYPEDMVKTKYICVGWADNRRRNIYERLFKYGFSFKMLHNQKVICKKLN